VPVSGVFIRVIGGWGQQVLALLFFCTGVGEPGVGLVSVWFLYWRGSRGCCRWGGVGSSGWCELDLDAVLGPFTRVLEDSTVVVEHGFALSGGFVAFS
jgi:hypothetical protein